MTVSCFNSFVHFAQCGNYGNLLSRFFDKNFVKTTHLVDSLNKPLKSWLDGKKFWWEQIFHFPTVCFVVAKEVTKELISRNFFNVIVFCSTFPPFGNNCFAFTKVFSKKCEKFTAPVFRNISVKSTFYLERPAPGLRPGYPGPIHGHGPGSEGVRVRVQNRRTKRGNFEPYFCPIYQFLTIFVHYTVYLAEVLECFQFRIVYSYCRSFYYLNLNLYYPKMYRKHCVGQLCNWK